MGKLLKLIGLLTTAVFALVIIDDLLKIKVERKKGGRKHGKRYYQVCNDKMPHYIDW